MQQVLLAAAEQENRCAEGTESDRAGFRNQAEALQSGQNGGQARRRTSATRGNGHSIRLSSLLAGRQSRSVVSTAGGFPSAHCQSRVRTRSNARCARAVRSRIPIACASTRSERGRGTQECISFIETSQEGRTSKLGRASDIKHGRIDATSFVVEVHSALRLSCISNHQQRGHS